MSESFAEQLSRVELMSRGDPTWDLSPNDCLALGAVLAEIERLRQHITTARNLLETHPMPSDAYRVLSEAINAEGGR